MNLPEELFTPGIDITAPDDSFRLDSGNATLLNSSGHTQGVARLRDVLVDNGAWSYRIGRVVQSHTSWTSGFAYYQDSSLSPDREAIFEGYDAALVGRPALISSFNHPSGMQAHGDVVAVGMEGRRAMATGISSYRDPELSPTTTAAVYFIRYSGTGDAAGDLINVLELDGNQVTSHTTAQRRLLCS